jgi:proteasome lid subunit RPN8/RPN11
MDSTLVQLCTAVDSVAEASVEMPAELCLKLLDQAQRIHDTGLKSYGLLVAPSGGPGDPLRPTDVIFFDPTRNRRNEPAQRSAFHAQGEYFRRYDDAGFVADPAELLAAYRRIDDAGLEPVAVFHSHRRQPANFSLIDYRLHNPAFPWHLIISFRTGRPVLQPFRVDKPDLSFGISGTDNLEGSEQAYVGDEVRPLGLVIAGRRADVRDCTAALAPVSPDAGERAAAA